MSDLTTEELADVSACIHARIKEFDSAIMHKPSRGEVRLYFDEIARWMVEHDYWGADGPDEDDAWESDRGGHADDDPLGDVYHAGFMRGREVGRQEAGSAGAPQGPRLVTHSAPIDDPPTGDPPPAANRRAGEKSGVSLIDITDFTEAWPNLADQPDGIDVFPNLPIAGEPDPPAPSLPTINTNGSADSDRAARQAELETVVDILRGIAVDGEMPTVAQYDAARRGDCPGWVTLSKRHGLTWADIARRAGLRYTRQGSLEREVKELRDKAARHDAQRQVTYDEFVAEIRRIAMGGAMPTQRQFDESKPAVWPTATALVMRFHTSWEEVAEACGLDYQRGRKTIKGAA